MKSQITDIKHYLENPEKYHVRPTASFVYKITDLELAKQVLKVDKRKVIQDIMNRKLEGLERSMSPLYALTLYHSGRVGRDELKSHLGNDGKYVDTIADKYMESRARNEKVKRGDKPEVAVSLRLFNIPWNGKLKLNDGMFVSPDVNNIIQRGYYK